MSDTFWMFPEGVAKLTAQIDRAREDATQAKAHVTRYCTLSLGQVGLLPDTFGLNGVHRNTVQLVERTLGGLAGRLEYVVEGIQASVADYQSVDDETSRVFDLLAAPLSGDRSLPPSYSRYGLTFPGVSFSDLAEPTQVLRDPGIGQKKQLWDFDPWTVDWFVPSAYVRDFVKDAAGGRDPFQEAALAFSGDWMLFQRVGFVWTQIETFCRQLGKNLARAAFELRDVWRGREAEAAERYVLALANAATDFAQICGQLVAQYSNAMTAAEQFNKIASGVLADIVTNALLGIATRAAKAGPPMAKAMADVALGLILARIAQQVYKWSDIVDKVRTGLDGIAAIVNSVKFTGLDALGVERSLR